MLRKLLCGLVLAIPALGAGARAAEPAPDPLAYVVLERLAAADAPACLMVALVEDRVRLTYACTRDAGPVLLTRDSIFEIGSITKVMTGLLLADMVRRGEVSLDDPASKHSRPHARLPAQGEREITLRDLVAHTSGLPRLPPGFAPADPKDPYADFTADRLYEALAATRFAEDIGTRYEYSNFGYMWLSEMLARRAGKPFEAALAERVLQPLGLSDTAMRLAAPQRARMVAGHDASYRPAPEWTFAPDMGGAGGLRASMADMVRLAQAIAGRVETPLRDTIELALAPLRPAWGNNSTGFGWITHERDGTRVHWHNGGTGGFRSMIAVNAGTRSAAVVLVDSAQSFDDLALHLVDPEGVALKRRGRR